MRTESPDGATRTRQKWPLISLFQRRGRSWRHSPPPLSIVWIHRQVGGEAERLVRPRRRQGGIAGHARLHLAALAPGRAVVLGTEEVAAPADVADRVDQAGLGRMQHDLTHHRLQLGIEDHRVPGLAAIAGMADAVLGAGRPHVIGIGRRDGDVQDLLGRVQGGPGQAGVGAAEEAELGVGGEHQVGFGGGHRDRTQDVLALCARGRRGDLATVGQFAPRSAAVDALVQLPGQRAGVDHLGVARIESHRPHRAGLGAGDVQATRLGLGQDLPGLRPVGALAQAARGKDVDVVGGGRADRQRQGGVIADAGVGQAPVHALVAGDIGTGAVAAHVDGVLVGRMPGRTVVEGAAAPADRLPGGRNVGDGRCRRHCGRDRRSDGRGWCHRSGRRNRCRRSWRGCGCGCGCSRTLLGHRRAAGRQQHG